MNEEQKRLQELSDEYQKLQNGIITSAAQVGASADIVVNRATNQHRSSAEARSTTAREQGRSKGLRIPQPSSKLLIDAPGVRQSCGRRQDLQACWSCIIGARPKRGRGGCRWTSEFHRQGDVGGSPPANASLMPNSKRIEEHIAEAHGKSEGKKMEVSWRLCRMSRNH
jgi:hypothetical protein